MTHSWTRMLMLSLLVLSVATEGCRAKYKTKEVHQLNDCFGTTEEGFEVLAVREEELVNKRSCSDYQAAEIHKKLEILRKKLEQFNKTKDWGALRRDLEEMLDHECAAYKQLQYIKYDEVWPMWYVGVNGYKELATVIVVGGQGLEVQDADGGTILQGAALRGRVDMVDSLLDDGANMEVVSGVYCRTAIIFATEEYRPEVVKLLARRGANLDRGNCDGDTSLHWAAWNGHLDVVKILVEAGADTAATNNNGLTALQNCRRKGRTAEVEYLSQFPH